MPRSLVHHTVAILCLAAICFRAVASMGLVACSGAEGGTKLEWGCARDVAGQCASDCDDAPAPEPCPGDGDEPMAPAEPCDDRPVTTEASATLERSGKPSLSIAELFPVAVLIATFSPAPWRIESQEAPSPGWHRARVESPPPGLGSLRTVILLV